MIRGTHSIKDTLTAVTGAVVPFHHSVLHDGGISELVLGYAHCGMVAAARWIAKLSTSCLLKALDEYPEYEVKVIDTYHLDTHLVSASISLALGQRRCFAGVCSTLWFHSSRYHLEKIIYNVMHQFAVWLYFFH